MANKRAEQLITLGLHPVLLGCSGDDLKRPLHKGWQTAVYTAADVKRWPPNNNVGIRCGQQRNGRSLLVFDFDEEARRIFPAWIDQANPKLHLPFVLVTSGRGCHLYFYTEAAYAGRTLAGRYDGQNGRKRLVKFIETLGSGRQVVAVGGRHSNGQQYHFSRGLDYEDIPTLTEAQYHTLLRLSKTFDKRPSAPTRTATAPPQLPPPQLVTSHNCLTYARHYLGALEHVERNGDIRFLGHGGLLITANGQGWYSFADETGGGLAELMAWHRAWAGGA